MPEHVHKVLLHVSIDFVERSSAFQIRNILIGLRNKFSILQA